MLTLVLLIGLCTQQQADAGTLVIDADLPVGSVRGDYFEAAWLFVDGKLIGRLPLKRTITLGWGSHDIKIVVGAYTNEKPRYFTVRWPRYFINRGATHTLVAAPLLQGAVDGEKLPADMEYRASPEPSRPLPPLHVTPEIARSFGQAEMKELNQAFLAVTSTQNDYAKVREALSQAKAWKEPAPVVWIGVSPDLGGPREFEARQLLFLARVLRPNAGEWRTRAVTYSPALAPADRESVEQLIDSLRKGSANYDKMVDDTIRELIALLAKGR